MIRLGFPSLSCQHPSPNKARLVYGFTSMGIVRTTPTGSACPCFSCPKPTCFPRDPEIFAIGRFPFCAGHAHLPGSEGWVGWVGASESAWWLGAFFFPVLAARAEPLDPKFTDVL